MFGQGATVVVDPACLQGSPSPPRWCGAGPPALLSAVTTHNAPPHHRVPPYRALPPPSPYRVGWRGLQPLSRGPRLTWEQQMRRWVARSDLAPAIRRWLAQVSRSLPPRSHRSEGALATVACALYALERPAPRLLRLWDILMGCFLSWTAAGAHPRWGLSPLNCVLQAWG